jgi:tryptophan synthase alpha chain
VESSIAHLRTKTTLPCTVGFGIRSPEQAGGVARFADGAVVGTAIVSKIFENINAGAKRAALVSDVAGFCRSLADSVHAARK